MKIQVAVFWVMTPCSDVVGYRRFGGPCCLRLQGELDGAWTEIQVVFWVMTPCRDVVGHRRFGGPCCLCIKGELSGAWIEIQVVLRVMTLCSDVVGYQRFFIPYHPEDGGSKVLRKVCVLPLHYTVSTQKTTTGSIERIVLLDFIHRLVSQKTKKIEELKIIDKRSQYTRPQTNHTRVNY